MENLYGKLGNEVSKTGYNKEARFRLSPEELDVTKDMVLTGEITPDKGIVAENLYDSPVD